MSENEYKFLVLGDYDQKKAAGLLTAELMTPTPGSIKSESVRICESRFHSSDEVLLVSFFKQKENGAAYRLAIQNSSADLFRPLVSLIRDRSINTALKNINLLAWLIDFQPRPYRPDLPFPVQPITTTIPPDDRENEPTARPRQPLFSPAAPAKNTRMAWWLFFALALLVVAGYFFHAYLYRLTGQERCMIWDDDHYQPMNCSAAANKYSAPIDRQRVNFFKKITQPDTLSPYSIKKVWYAKFKGRVEFYTAGGAHPLDSNRRLLPMTDHILKKYVYHLEN